MKSSHKIIIGIVVIGVIFGFFFRGNITGSSTSEASGEYDSFAKCLTDSGMKMYGAYWCPHCNDQKEMFGDSWKNINYIECSLPGGNGQTKICIQEGIRAYPTWELPDGVRIEGGLSFSQLSEYSGCSLE